MFSAEALTSCKLANINHAIREQQAACQSPGTKTLLPATCRPFTAPPHPLTVLLICSKNSNIFYILSSNFKKKKKNFAKNILAIRCFSKNNKNIQVFIGLTFCSLLYWKEIFFSTIDGCLSWWQILCGLTLDFRPLPVCCLLLLSCYSKHTPRYVLSSGKWHSGTRSLVN